MQILQHLQRMGAVWFLGLLVAGCASGPTLSEMSASIPPVGASDGRFYIYRTTGAAAAIQPSVKVNDEVVGDAVPRGFFYVDRPAGSYKISTSTEVERTLSLTLEPGQVRYVRLGISMGFFVGHVYPELVDDAEGKDDIASLHYTGKLPEKAAAR